MRMQLLPFGLVAFLCLALTPWGGRAQCPEPTDDPIMYDDSHFLCAQTWDGEGGDSGCNLCPNNDIYNEFYDGEVYEADSGSGECFPAGSVVVKPGCTFTTYDGYYSDGDFHEYSGPMIVPNEPLFISGTTCGGCPVSAIHSYSCTCQQKPITCTPTDGFEEVIVCDNTQGGFNLYCSFYKSIGTSFSEEVSASMDIDPTIATELSRQYFDRYATELGSSLYPWDDPSPEAMAPTEKVPGDVEAPAGYRVVIEQDIGHCGEDGITETEFFSVTTTFKGVSEVRYERHLRDGTIIKYTEEEFLSLKKRKSA